MVTVDVSFTDGYGNAEAITSDATDIVPNVNDEPLVRLSDMQ